MVMRIHLETSKGNYSGTYGQCIFWLRQHKPSHGNVIVPGWSSGVFEERSHMGILPPELDTNAAWLEAWTEIVEDVYDCTDHGRDLGEGIAPREDAALVAAAISQVLDGNHPHCANIEEVEQAVMYASRLVAANHP